MQQKEKAPPPTNRPNLRGRKLAARSNSRRASAVQWRRGSRSGATSNRAALNRLWRIHPYPRPQTLAHGAGNYGGLNERRSRPCAIASGVARRLPCGGSGTCTSHSEENMSVFDVLFLKCPRCASTDVAFQGWNHGLALCRPCNRRFQVSRAMKAARCVTCSSTFAKDAPPGWKCPECFYEVRF